MVNWRALTDDVEHRPWPLPERPWVVTMSWLDLLFAHWRCEPATLAALLPAGLELDTFDGRAYLGLVPFRMEKVGPRGLGWLPGRLPGPRAFPELNVRTYVVKDGKPGVWFLSLDAASSLAVWGARTSFHLPYFHAEITADDVSRSPASGDVSRLPASGGTNGWIHFASRRTDRRLGAGELRARFRGAGERPQARPGSLEHWLTERYCLYAADDRGHVRRGDIHHLPWPLQDAEVEIETNTVVEAHGLTLDGPPELVHFVRRIDVVGWWLDRPEG